MHIAPRHSPRPCKIPPERAYLLVQSAASLQRFASGSDSASEHVITLPGPLARQSDASSYPKHPTDGAILEKLLPAHAKFAASEQAGASNKPAPTLSSLMAKCRPNESVAGQSVFFRVSYELRTKPPMAGGLRTCRWIAGMIGNSPQTAQTLCFSLLAGCPDIAVVLRAPELKQGRPCCVQCGCRPCTQQTLLQRRSSRIEFVNQVRFVQRCGRLYRRPIGLESHCDKRISLTHLWLCHRPDAERDDNCAGDADRGYAPPDQVRRYAFS